MMNQVLFINKTNKIIALKQAVQQPNKNISHKIFNKMHRTGNSTSYTGTDESKTFPLIPDEIHKVPQNIRKAIKVGKHRKNINNNNNLKINMNSASLNSQSYNNYPPAVSSMNANTNAKSIYGTGAVQYVDQAGDLVRDNIKDGGLQVRQIFNFMVGRNYSGDAKQEEDQVQGRQSMVEKYFKSQGAKNKVSGDRILYARKKLIPLKKGLTVEPRQIVTRDKRNFKVTFLNVEKLELVKMYNQSPQKPKNDIPNKTAMTAMNLAASMNSTGNNNLIQNFLESTGLGGQNNALRRSFYDKSPSKLRMKPFVPPFQRYYYRDFIWKCAFSYSIFHQAPENYDQKFKVFIGRGNNSMLLKSLMKRRKSWWTFTDRYDQAHFAWTQIKINIIFTNQKNQKAIYHSPQQFCPQKNEKKPNLQWKQNIKILNQHEYLHWQEYFQKFRKSQDTLDQTMKKRNRIFCNSKNNSKFTCKNIVQLDLKNIRIHNHLPNNYIISNKKALFYTMSKFYEKTKQEVFQYLPLTFHIQNGLEDPEYLKFLNSYYERAKKIRARDKDKQTAVEPCSPSKSQKVSPEKQKKQSPQKLDALSPQKRQKQLDQQSESPTSPSRISTQNMWIVKPGQFTNRGNGITVCMNLQQIKAILKRKQRHDNGNYKTYIIQSYIQKPFLYQRRKFDLRHYMMITSINGIIKGYWYEMGYIRTTSFQYTVKNGLSSVHLTNDAVQKYLPEYGKYEKGNKISYEQFQKYLQKQYGNQYDFYQQIYPKMKKIATDSIKACSLMIDPEKKGHNFQIFGMDFMIDGDFHPWLIQINNNPCLQLSCPLLGEIIPPMVQNALKICLDSLIPPPTSLLQRRSKMNQNIFETNKFELVYDSTTEQTEMLNIFEGKCKLDLDYKQLEKDQDEVFDDDGIQLDD